MDSEHTTSGLAEVWDVTPRVVPMHSRLYCLEPVGVGTPLVESMTSYVVRLAAAHHVQTSRLVAHELIPRFRPQLLSRHQSLSVFWNGSASLNGVAPHALKWASLLEGLTQRKDLQYLTMLPWAAVLVGPRLLRATRAWCPQCYDEWRVAGQPVYDPLLWALVAVTLCPAHKTRLHTRCPYPDCGRTMRYLSPCARPGHCAHCARWLGTAGSTALPGLPCTALELQWQQWVATVVGELLMSAPGLNAFPTGDTLARTLTRYVQEAADISPWRFANETGICIYAFTSARKRQHACSLLHLLRACACLRISLLALLDVAPTGQEPRLQPVPEMGSLPRLSPPAAHDWENIGRALEAVLADETVPPPSMRQTALHLNCYHSRLIEHFPTLCHAISARYTAWRAAQSQVRLQELTQEIREAARQLQAQGIFPGKWQIQKYIGRPLLMRDRTVREIWRTVMTELGLLDGGPLAGTTLEA